MADTHSRGFLGFLYGSAAGRLLLKGLASRRLSRIAGKFLDSPLSKPLIGPFVRDNNIDLNDYTEQHFSCFNDCFTRQILPELRPIPMDPNVLMSPCDGLLTVYPVEDGLVMPIKQSRYTVSDLLGGDPMWERYRDGVCLVFRLCVNHYHRYCYMDSGSKGENRFIPGELHTVRPVALETLPVFVRNCREYTCMNTDHFGTAVQIEVGAMLVGKIKNHHGAATFRRGQEKGMFLYGGSTIVLLLEKNRVQLRGDILTASENGKETPVQMGETLGIAL